MRNRLSICLLLLLGLVVGDARADDFDAATAAAKKGDHLTAFNLLKPLAEKGDARAQSELGAIYTAGKGVPVDGKEALKWTKLAAEHGDAAAQANLGTIYMEGRFTKVDFKEAMKWNLLAADKGVAAAQANIAAMYYEGQGVAQDYKEAAKWMRLAAEQGDGESQVNLGTMYTASQGVERDLLRGYMWTSIGLETLPMPPADKKSMLDSYSETLSAQEISRAQAMAKSCKELKFRNCG